MLLLAVGEERAAALLPVLAHSHLRGYLQPDMEVCLSLLRLLPALVAEHDIPLAVGLFGPAPHDDSRGVPPFALPWVLTWLSHSNDSLRVVLRLFDLFLCAHPLMPLYVSAALVLRFRGDLHRHLPGGAEEDDGQLFVALQRLPARMPAQAPVADVLADAAALYARMPPAVLLDRAATRADAVLLAERWPELWMWSAAAGERDPLLARRPDQVERTRSALARAYGLRRGLAPPATEALARFAPVARGVGEADAVWGAGDREGRAWQRRLAMGTAVAALLLAVVLGAALGGGREDGDAGTKRWG